MPMKHTKTPAFNAKEFRTPEQLGMFVTCAKCGDDKVVFDGLLQHYYHHHKSDYWLAQKQLKQLEAKERSLLQATRW